MDPALTYLRALMVSDLDMPDLRAMLGRPAWQARAACRGVGTALFFRDKPGVDRPAKAICRVCEVRELCLRYALADPELQGIWGGTSTRERRLMRSESA